MPARTGCSLNSVFSFKFCDFSELCQFCRSAGVLPAWCVYTHCHRGKTESRIFFKIRKKTQYLMNTLYKCEKCDHECIVASSGCQIQKKNIKHLMESPLFMQDVHSDDCQGSSFSKMCPQCTEFHFMNHVCREVNNHVYILTFTFKIVTAHSLSSFFLS